MINPLKIKDKRREDADGRPPAKKQIPGELVLPAGWCISQNIGYIMLNLLKIDAGGLINLLKIKDKRTEDAHGRPPAKKQSPGGLINLLKIKDKRREDAHGRPPAKKQSPSPGELVLHKDISELKMPKNSQISFPNGKNDLMNFEIVLRPHEGYYQGGSFLFTFQVPPGYPHEAPKVKCKTKVYHPNIDLEGNVRLNILLEDSKPILNIKTIIYGLYHLFIQPNHEDPLNKEAAVVMRDNPKAFSNNVKKSMAGGYVGSTYFPKCMSKK